jgi:hypothetical protein
VVVDADEWTIPNLVMFIQRLARHIRKTDFENKFARDALDFIERKKIGGSILREVTPATPAPTAPATEPEPEPCKDCISYDLPMLTCMYSCKYRCGNRDMFVKRDSTGREGA